MHYTVCPGLHSHLPATVTIPNTSHVSTATMDDVLPNFKPVENSPVLSSAEMQHLLFKPTDRRLENAQQACKSLDVCRASLTIQHLQRAGIPAEDLQLCLLGAVESEAYDLIRVLLLAGVPLSALVIKPALEQNSLRTLSMFREHGWEINREEAWCIPPWLSYVLCDVLDSPLLICSVQGWPLQQTRNSH